MSEEVAVASNENTVVRLLAAVNFVNVLDFMMVMPLGPDLAEGLGIPLNRLGLVGGSYTAAAAVAGGFGALFLDRFDRKRAFCVSVLALAFATAIGAFAWDFTSLVCARMLAGVFGGQATALSLSILADVVPPERRGRAMGRVMGAFAAASVLGVPLGLELAHWGDWRTPFFAVAALGVLAAVAIRWGLPQLQVSGGPIMTPKEGVRWLVGNTTARISLIATSFVFFGGFSIIPHLSSFVQHNLGFPRQHLGILYLIGGSVSFFAMRAAGRVVDKHGPHSITIIATAVLLLSFGFGFLPAHPGVPPVALFLALMVSNSVRGVALNSLMSQVPPPQARARFMSANAMVQHTAAALGAMVSSAIIYERADHSLGGISELAILVMLTASVVPALVWLLAQRVRAARAAQVGSA